MPKIFRALTVASMIALAGCASTAQFVSNTATNLSQSSPSQAKTLGEALLASTLITKTADAYVVTAKPSPAVRAQIGVLNEGLHTALVNLQRANANGLNLALAAFNEALTAFRSYATATGIKI